MAFGISLNFIEYHIHYVKVEYGKYADDDDIGYSDDDICLYVDSTGKQRDFV